MKLRRSTAILLAIILMVSLLSIPAQASAEGSNAMTETLQAGTLIEHGLTLHTAESERAARGIGPQWLNTDYIVHGISIGSGGASTVSVSYYTYSSTDKIRGTATLQRQTSSGSYTDVKTWNFSGTGSAYLSEQYTVASGSYRVKTVGNVYTSSGSFVETVTVYSQRKTY